MKLGSVGPQIETYQEYLSRHGADALIRKMRRAGLMELDVRARVSRSFTDEAAKVFILSCARKLHENVFSLEWFGERFGWGSRGGRRLRRGLAEMHKDGLLTTRGIPFVGTRFFFSEAVLDRKAGLSLGERRAE